MVRNVKYIIITMDKWLAFMVFFKKKENSTVAYISQLFSTNFFFLNQV